DVQGTIRRSLCVHRTLQLVVKKWVRFPTSPALPLLIKRGFRGPAYCSRATRDLCAILLPDAGHLQEKDAEFANRHGFSKHKPALPLYTWKMPAPLSSI